MRPEQFTIGWICALPHELAASRAMLDEEFEMNWQQDATDENVYHVGRISSHNIVMACLPAKAGTQSTAAVAKDMRWSFKSIKCVLMVGIGGGVPLPSRSNDIRLGDIVVSKPTQTHGGVIQYDMGKVRPNGTFERRGHLQKPPRQLLAAIQSVQSAHGMSAMNLQQHLDTMARKFPDMKQKYGPPGLEGNDVVDESGETFSRPARLRDDGSYDPSPKIHYGLIASGDKVIASAAERDRLCADDEILCFEMEAAGLMDAVPCLVVRGICDYANALKNDDWQNYAAATAAAYTRELLQCLPASAPIEPTARRQNEINEKYKVGFALPSTSPVPMFVGRQEQMADLTDFFSPDEASQSRKIYVLSGMGGIGKTQLCLHFARTHKDAYTACIWIDGSSIHTVKQSFRRFANRLAKTSKATTSVSEQHDDDRLVQEVMDWLSLDENTRWLLVFDNVDLDHESLDPDPLAYDIEQFIPSTDHGCVLVTTRLRSLESLGSYNNVQGLGSGDALKLLEAKLGILLAEDKDAKETVHLLGGLPLALTLAGAYIKRTGCSLSTYNRQYSTEWESLATRQDRFKVREYGSRQMLTTWSISFKQVKQTSPTAAHMFQLWSFFNCTNLNHNLLAPPAHRNTEEKSFEKPLWLSEISLSQERFLDEMQHLLQYSLASVVSEETYSMHALLHQWSFLQLASGGTGARNEIASLAVATLGLQIKRDEFHGYDLQHLRAILPHVVVLASRLASCATQVLDLEEAALGELAKHLCALASLLRWADKLVAAEDMFTLALHGSEKSHGPQDRLTLSILNDFGVLYDYQGNKDMAKEMFERALKAREITLGAEHLSTLRTVCNLAGIYRANGKLHEAQQMFERGLRGFEKELGPEHPLVSKTHNNLASVHEKLGNFDAAESLYERSLHEKERSLRPDHPATLYAVNNLAKLYRQQGKLDIAQTMFEWALQGREKAYGPAHILTLHVVYGLGIVHDRQGDYESARAMYEWALQGYENARESEKLQVAWLTDRLAYLRRVCSPDAASPGNLELAEPPSSL